MVDINELEQATKQMAQEAGLSEDDYNALLNKCEEEVTFIHKVDDPEQIKKLSLKRLQLSLKMRFASGKGEAEGFLMTHGRLVDFAKNPLAEAKKKVAELGKQKAMSLGICNSMMQPVSYGIIPERDEDGNPKLDEKEWYIGEVTYLTGDSAEHGIIEMPPLDPLDFQNYVSELGIKEAQDIGLINENGNFVYINHKFKNGDEIPEHDYNRDCFGIFLGSGDTMAKLYKVALKGDQALNPPALFQRVKINGSINSNKSTADYTEMSVYEDWEQVSEEFENYWDFAGAIEKAAPHRILKNLQGVEGFVKSIPEGEYGAWCVVEADIMDIGAPVGDEPGERVVPIRITDYTMTSLKSDDASITLWANENIPLDFKEQTADAVVFMAPYINKKGKLGGNLIGYWIEPAFRKGDVPAMDANDVGKAWKPN